MFAGDIVDCFSSGAGTPAPSIAKNEDLTTPEADSSMGSDGLTKLGNRAGNEQEKRTKQ
jgi:hypothetical protein